MRFNPSAAGRQGWNNTSWNFSSGKPQLPELLVNNARKGGGGARRTIESRVGRGVEGGVEKITAARSKLATHPFKSLKAENKGGSVTAKQIRGGRRDVVATRDRAID